MFIVSGFLVSKSFLRRSNIKSFLIKRLMRIYPPFIVCVILTAILGFFISEVSLRAYLPGAIANITNNLLMRPKFSLPGVFEHNPYPHTVNGSLWTLPIELLCFILLPVYLRIIKKVKHKFAICTVIAILASLLAIYVNTCCIGKILVFWATDWMQAVRLITYFLWGTAFSMLSLERLKQWCRGDIAVLLLCFALIWGSCYRPQFNYFLLPYIIISFAFSGDGIFRDFLNKHDYVYGIYLWAFPVQQTIIYLLLGKLPSVLLLFVLSMGIILVLAVLTGKFIEEPVAQLTKRLIK